jgi:hypothetical protein
MVAYFDVQAQHFSEEMTKTRINFSQIFGLQGVTGIRDLSTAIQLFGILGRYIGSLRLTPALQEY